VSAELIRGDCREVMPQRGPFDLLIADPPYGDTALKWDQRVEGWESIAAAALKPTGSIWVFGSLRMLMETAENFRAAGLRMAQDIVWEKQNGTGFLNDRFKRVHEHAVQFYRADSPWKSVWNEVQKTQDATARTVQRKGAPPHLRNIQATAYVSEDGGPRLMRSVIAIPNCHGHAIHETEKPVALLGILIRTSCPPGGLVGDMFAGSGAAGEAAMHAGRRYIGCELDPEYFRRASDRLSGRLPLGTAA